MIEPKLRFKADDGSQFSDWEEKTIDEVAECLDNKRVPVNSEERKKRVGVIPYYGAGGIQGHIDDYLFDEELILLLEDGDAFDDFQTKSIAQYVTGKSWVNNHAHVLRANGNPYFLFASLEHKDIRRWTQLAGASRKKLLKDSMLKITVNMPSLPEQQKIAEFLSTIDTVIEKQKETVSAWEERKKGMMQKLFSQEVRFKANDGSDFPEWEEKKLSELFKKVIEKNRLDLPPLTIVQGYGTIRRDESERRIAYDEKGLKNYKAVQKDDFIVHLRSFEGGLEIANQDGIVSPAYHVYRGNGEVHPSFYYPYFRSSSFIKGKLAICVTGVRDGKNIEMGSFDELLIPHPCPEEQQKIADCLSSLDEVIQKQKATLAAWEELKKGLLQQMFV